LHTSTVLNLLSREILHFYAQEAIILKKLNESVRQLSKQVDVYKKVIPHTFSFLIKNVMNH